MNNDKRQSSNHDWCPPPTDDPAPQPQAPGSCDCPKPDWPPPPDCTKPNDCKEHDCECKCPPDKKVPPPDCLQNASDRQAKRIAAGDRAKAFKTDLDAFRTKTMAASLDYTRDKYDKLVKQWEQEDRDIAELIRKLVCAVPCWQCIIECYVCPLIQELHNQEKWLKGSGRDLYPTAANLYDLQYWRTRDKAIKQDRVTRIKAVLTAWEKPAQTIQNYLNNNQTLINASCTNLCTGPGPVIYDVFLHLIPLHLSIAPPRSRAETRIDVRYTKLCTCDDRDPEECCGVDIGLSSFRERLVGPTPFLIDPDSYFKLICCLVEKAYEPAKEALAQAEIDAAALDAQITGLETQVNAGLTALEQSARASIPSVVDCCDYEEQDDDAGRSPHSR